MAARDRIAARTDNDSEIFLRKEAGSRSDTAKIIAAVLTEEGHAPTSIHGFVQGITAVARTRLHPDGRLELEDKAKRLLKRVRA